MEIAELEIEKIVPSPFQPRETFDKEALEELANSITEFDLLNPIPVSFTLPVPVGFLVRFPIGGGRGSKTRVTLQPGASGDKVSGFDTGDPDSGSDRVIGYFFCIGGHGVAVRQAGLNLEGVVAVGQILRPQLNAEVRVGIDRKFLFGLVVDG